MSEELTGEQKFETCLHRSAEKEKAIVSRCACDGGDYEDEGFKCKARSIFKVDHVICQYCWLYEKKS